MQSPIEFIQDYLKEQVRLYEFWSTSYAPVRARFFEQAYNPFDPQKNIARAEAEAILESSGTEGAPVVTTTGYGDGHRLRYTLQAAQGAWRISRVQIECGICRGTGEFKEKACKLCKGEGWKTF
jgi:DnaJ-class molecular chaperone